jgi:site-specific DNA recombinase
VLARLLHHPYYTGMLRWKGALYQGNQDPLVSQETFDMVQNVLDTHDKRGQKQRVHRHYLKGSVRCDRCKASLCITRAGESPVKWWALR